MLSISLDTSLCLIHVSNRDELTSAKQSLSDLAIIMSKPKLLKTIFIIVNDDFIRERAKTSNALFSPFVLPSQSFFFDYDTQLNFTLTFIARYT